MNSVGGVCPFALATDVSVFLDVSLERFSTVYPACGSNDSSIELTIAELQEYAGPVKISDVCKGWDPDLVG